MRQRFFMHSDTKISVWSDRKWEFPPYTPL